MRRRWLPACLLAAAVAGCGPDAPAPLADRVRDGQLRVFAWDERAVLRGCRDEDAARDTPGTALRARGRAGCWVVVRGAPLATSADVAEVREDEQGISVGFVDGAAARLRGVGPDGHVGVAVGEELLEVVHPGGGRVRIGAPPG